jgi:hypothetical protein
MAFSPSTKKAVDIMVPSLAAGAVVWVVFKRTKDWRYLAAAAALTFLLAYLITSQLTKVAYVNGPAPVPTGGGCDGYDPTALVDGIYNDTTCTLCLRDRNLYDQLLGLADCQLLKAANYWNGKYYADTGKSLPVMIAAQSSFFDSDFGQQQKGLKAKFATLNLQ